MMIKKVLCMYVCMIMKMTMMLICQPRSWDFQFGMSPKRVENFLIPENFVEMLMFMSCLVQIRPIPLCALLHFGAVFDNTSVILLPFGELSCLSVWFRDTMMSWVDCDELTVCMCVYVCQTRVVLWLSDGYQCVDDVWLVLTTLFSRLKDLCI